MVKRRRSGRGQPARKRSTYMQEYLQQQLKLAEERTRRATLAADRAARAQRRAERQEQAAQKALTATKPEPMVWLDVTFYLPLKNDDDSHATVLHEKKKGKGERKHHKDDQGRYWQEMQRISVAIPKKALKGLTLGQVYWHAGAGMTPTIKDSAQILKQSEIQAHWYQLSSISGKTPAVKFEDGEEIPAAGHHDPLDEPNLAGAQNSRYRTHKHLAVPEGTLRQWLTAGKPDVDMSAPRACAAEILLSLYGEPITAYQKGEIAYDHRRFITRDGKPSIVMTLPGLYEFFHPGEPYTGGDFPLSLREFRTFFTKFGVKLVVTNNRGELLKEACYTPATPSRLRTCYILQADSHLYALNARLPELSARTARILQANEHAQGARDTTQLHGEATQEELQRRARQVLNSNPEGVAFASAPAADPPKPLSNRTYVPSTPLKRMWIDSLEDIASIDWSSAGAGTEGPLRLTCDLDLDALAAHLLVLGVHPHFTCAAGKIVKLALSVMPEGADEPRDVTISNLETPDAEGHPTIRGKDEYELYTELSEALSRTVMNSQTLSTYSGPIEPRPPFEFSAISAHLDAAAAVSPVASEPPQLAAVLHHLMPGPLVFGRPELKGGMHSEIIVYDMNRAHSGFLANITHVPVFCEFDVFCPYDPAKPIEPLSLYIVRAKPGVTLSPYTALFLMLDKDVNVIMGECLKLLRSQWAFHQLFVVESVCTPHRIVAVDPAHVIKQVLESPLHTEVAKFCINRVVGLLGRKQNSRDVTVSFEGVDAALAYQASCAGSSISRRKLGDKEVYFVTSRSQVPLSDGFLPIYLMIMRAQRRALYTQAQAVGREYVACKTDALWFPRTPEDQPVPKKRDFASIKAGTWSVDQGGYAPSRPPKDHGVATDAALVPEPTPATQVTQLSLADEYDDDELVRVLSGGRTLMLADLPGCGKTQALIRYAQKTGKRMLLTSPYNALCASFAAKGVEACTAHDVLGVRVSDSGEEKSKTRRDVAGYELIVFDEVFCFTTKLLARIRDYMHEHPEIEFHAAGDPLQLGAIEPLRFRTEQARMQYYGEIVSSMFPRQLMLHVVKRVASLEDAQLLATLKQLIWAAPQWDAAARQRVLSHFRVITRLDQLPIGCERGVMCASFHTHTARAIGDALHTRALQSAQSPQATTAVGRLRIFPGLRLRCTSYLRLGEVRLHTNFIYAVVSVNKRKAQVTLKRVDTAEKVCVSFEQVARYMTYDNSQTTHSLQGASVDAECLLLADTDSPYATRAWLYTALTRGRVMANVYVYKPEEQEAVALGLREADLARKLGAKVRGYKSQDARAGRDASASDYITAAWMAQQLHECGWRCMDCGVTMALEGVSQLTADRLDNALPHTKGNTRLCCFGCNRIAA